MLRFTFHFVQWPANVCRCINRLSTHNHEDRLKRAKRFFLLLFSIAKENEKNGSQMHELNVTLSGLPCDRSYGNSYLSYCNGFWAGFVLLSLEWPWNIVSFNPHKMRMYATKTNQVNKDTTNHLFLREFERDDVVVLARTVIVVVGLHVRQLNGKNNRTH